MGDSRSRPKVGEIVREYGIAVERAGGTDYLRSVIIRRDSTTQYRVQTVCRGNTPSLAMQTVGGGACTLSLIAFLYRAWRLKSKFRPSIHCLNWRTSLNVPVKGEGIL